jgi:hypothetical protein
MKQVDACAEFQKQEVSQAGEGKGFPGTAAAFCKPLNARQQNLIFGLHIGSWVLFVCFWQF